MKYYIIYSMFFLVFSCYNPFSPVKGTPTQGRLNNTPEDVFKNLEIAYETQDLKFFMSLLSDDFKFFVSSDFTPERAGTKTSIKAEDVDNDGKLETYLSRDWEERTHERIFRAAKKIELNLLPCPACTDSTLWEKWIDNKTGDTLGIYITISNITLKLESKSGMQWRLTSRAQKFGLKKKAKDTTQWVIGQWHEMD